MTSELAFFCIHYLVWHYTRAIADIFRAWAAFIWFVFHYFSIPVLLRTLISPWRRMGERGPNRFAPVEWISAHLTNIILRFIGLCMRLFVIAIGVCALVGVIAALPIMLTIWFAAPLVVILCFLLTIRLVIR